MMNQFKEILDVKQQEMADLIRILTYKENSEILSKLKDLGNNDIFLNPILFAYHNRKQIETFSEKEGFLEEFLKVYCNDFNKENSFLNTEKETVKYLPEIGYQKQGQNIEPFYLIKDTKIQILKYDMPLLRNVIHIVSQRTPVKDEQIELNEPFFDEYKEVIEKAFFLIKDNFESYFSILNQVVKKCAFYKVKNKENGKSFASINAQGLVFLRIHDKQLTEVYFVNELGYYSGKMIFTTMFHGAKDSFKIDHRTKLKDLVETELNTNVYTLLSDLFASTTVFLCLENILPKLEEELYKEAKLRMDFYHQKIKTGLTLFSQIPNFNEENFFSKESLLVFSFIKDTYTQKIKEKETASFSDFNFDTNIWDFLAPSSKSI